MSDHRGFLSQGFGGFWTLQPKCTRCPRVPAWYVQGRACQSNDASTELTQQLREFLAPPRMSVANVDPTEPDALMVGRVE